MSPRFVLLVLLAALCYGVAPSSAYAYRCMSEGCLCETADEVIFCNSRRLLAFPNLDRIDGRLRGFAILSLRDNDIHDRFPTTQALLNKLPELKAIDLHKNPRLNCTEVKEHYGNDFQVLCANDADPIPYPPPAVESRKDCDGNIGCQLERYSKKIAQEAERLWLVIEKELDKLAKNPLLKPVVSKIRDTWHRVVGGRGHSGINVKFWE